MKHKLLIKELEVKINDICHEALKEGGAHLFRAVQELSSALTSMMSYQPTPVTPPAHPEVVD